MNKRIESQIRQIETDLSNSLSNLPQPASEYTVKHLIRDKVMEVHRIGAEYACSHYGLRHFNTAHDFSQIGTIADDIYRVFTYAKNKESALIALTSITLAKAVKMKAKQISQAIANNDIDNILEVDSNNLAVVMTALARPTKSPGIKQIELKLPPGAALQPYSPSNVKAIELSLGLPLPTPESPPSETIPPDLSLDTTTDIPTDTTTTVDLFIWKTEQDALVCDEWCKPLEDQTWEIDDPDIPTPIIDTHNNCRCRIEIISEDITTGGD